MSPAKRHTPPNTLPEVSGGEGERLPDFEAVVAEFGQVPEFEIPTQPPSFMDEVDEAVAQEAEKRAPEIAAEVAAELGDQLPDAYDFEADTLPEAFTPFQKSAIERVEHPVQAIAQRLDGAPHAE